MKDAGEYGVTVQRVAPNAAGEKWEVASASHLDEWENRGRRNVLVRAYSQEWRELRGDDVRAAWTWDGRQPDEPAPPCVLNKPWSDPFGGDIALGMGQRASVWMDGGIPSDIVHGLRTDHEREGEGNYRGHHSFEVVFRLVRAAPPPPPPPPPVVPVGGSPTARLRALVATLRQGADALEEVADFQDGLSGGAQG